MTSGVVSETYEMVVGLEVHVQLKTRTKAFCACSTDFGAPPNTNVCPVCIGLPGALPVLNRRAVELATRAALALGCAVRDVSVFARKNYFYPDLPKGYQISQYDQPLAEKGRLEIGSYASGTPIVIGITRLHLEEDAGKSIHDRFAGESAIDLNRAGMPLIEIVSEPDIRSSRAARAYLQVLKQLLEYLAVSDVNMEEGSLRVDANISSRLRGDSALGTKTEVKNMNSFSAVERALEAEFARQCQVLADGGRVVQQTMLWDAAASAVRPARSKEDSHDYRYFPEPDLLPLVLAAKDVAQIQQSMPELPRARQQRFAREYELETDDVEVLTATPALADYYEHTARAHGDFKAAANWVRGEVLAALRTSGQDLAHFSVRPRDVAELLGLVRDRTITRGAAKQVFATMIATGRRPAEIVAEMGLVRVDDVELLRRWLDEVLAEHPNEAARFVAGDRRLRGVLVGYVMKKSKGAADPKAINQLLSERAGE